MSLPDVPATLLATVERLEAAGAEFALAGASALFPYTLPRATMDMDFLVRDDAAVRAQVEDAFFIVERTRDPVFEQDAWILEVPTRVTPVEVFWASHWFTRRVLERRTRASVPDLARDVPVPTLEDVVLSKAANAVHPSRAAYKHALDLADLGRLKDADAPFDAPYVRATAARLGDRVLGVLQDTGFLPE